MLPAPTAVAARPDAGRDHRWPALAVCLTAGFMTLLDVSIVNVAVPSIRTGLGASQSALQWVLSGYALMFGLVLVPAGRIGDVRSRRTVFLAGLALFTATSTLAGAAHSQTWLVAARLVQGAAGGVLVPQVSGFIQQMFRGPERGRAFGLLGTTIGVSTAVGPLLGGLLVEAFGAHEGWRWVFYVNLPIGLAVLPLAWRWLPGRSKGTAKTDAAFTPAEPGEATAMSGETAESDEAFEATAMSGETAGTPAGAGGSEGRPARHGRGDLDPVGVLLLGAGTTVLLLPFVEQEEWHGPQKWLLIPLALLILAGFAYWEHRYARRGVPLVDLRLFARGSYGLGVLLSLLYFAGFTAVFFILTLYLQNGLHYSALEAGLAIMPFALGSAVTAAAAGRRTSRFGRAMVTAGLLAVVAGLLLTSLALHLAAGTAAGWAAAAPLLFAGLGSGLVIAPNQTLTLSEVPVARAGSAGGVLQTAQRIGSAAGIAAVGSVFFSRLGGPRPDWQGAVQLGLLVATALAALALAVSLAGMAARRAAA